MLYIYYLIVLINQILLHLKLYFRNSKNHDVC